MTMYNLPNFCRVCLKYDKNLIDLEHIEHEPSETLMSKLTQCVSEVKWSVFKPLLCHPCIKRLNIAYSFKKQCIQSASVLENYITGVKDIKKKGDGQDKDTSANQPNAYMMLPNQKYIKIVVGSQNQNTFQNVFLNVVPTAAAEPKSKDTNQNVFLNINNTFQKYVPVAPAEPSVNQLLTEGKSEELSVEIDPKDFVECSDSEQDNGVDDWEEMISSTQITSNANGVKVDSTTKFGNYVPILPKQSDDKMEFFNSGHHFLSSTSDFPCEPCEKHFSSYILLKNHIRDFHLGKSPFKCDRCYKEFILRAEYSGHADVCVAKKQEDWGDSSLTLDHFKRESLDSGNPADLENSQENVELNCEICHRVFNSASGLLRHKVRKHNQKSKKKYFIKGMKNAKCDICNREFSTQSYMQLHRKLHLRDDMGYKFKVFSKDRYIKTDINEERNTDNHKDETSNNIEEEMITEDVIVKEEVEVEELILKEESDSENASEEN